MRRLALALFAVVFLDELASGVTPASAGDVARDLVLPAGLTAGAIIAAFHALAIFVEAPLLAWSERVTVRWFSAGSLIVLAVACALAALAREPVLFVIALALYGPASGGALSSAEGLLVEARPAERERTIARLTLAGALGDLAVPALLAALAWLGLGWRAGMAAAGIVALALAATHASSRALDRLPPGGDDDEDETSSVLERLRFALGHRALLAWSAAVSLTGLLDEVLVAFVVIRLDAASALERAFAVAAWTVGFLPGLFLLDRYAERVDTRRALLVAASAACASLLVLALDAHVAIASAALFVLGASTSLLYPLSEARTYASLPGRPALVNAVGALFTPLDALAPLALGALALWLGPEAAIAAIGVAPIGIALAALTSR
ncbi:MAG: MFS transporter [Sandaracinaceae bacterium]|nr:MFS transporter [Sandaracinaceae bacterium]